MTAMTRTSMVWESEIEPGEIRVFHHTERTPASPCDERAEEQKQPCAGVGRCSRAHACGPGRHALPGTRGPVALGRWRSET